MTRYEHTQIGHVIVWSLLPIILIASGGLIGSSAHRGAPVVVSIILLVCLVSFRRSPLELSSQVMRFQAVVIWKTGCFTKMRVFKSKMEEEVAKESRASTRRMNSRERGNDFTENAYYER